MITLHYLENSRAQRILWLLEELGVEYEIKHYYRNKETMLAPSELKEVHPLGKSPVLSDGDNCIAESAAIVEYLIDTHGNGKLIPKTGTKEFLKYREFMHYAEGSIMPFMLLSLIFNKIKEAPMPFFIKPIAKGIADKTMQNFVSPNLKTHLTYLDNELAKTGWFAGSEMTGADIMMSFPLEASAARTNLRDEYHNIASFLDKVHQMPSYKSAIDKGLPYAYA